MLRDLLTFFTGFAVIILLIIAGLLLGIILAIVLTIGGIDPAKSPIFSVISYLASFIFIALPYNLIATYFIYNAIKDKDTKCYGMLGGPMASGALCWLFNVWSLPYVLYAKIWPVDYKPLPEPIPNKKQRFIIGWVIGLIISILATMVQLIVTMSKM